MGALGPPARRPIPETALETPDTAQDLPEALARMSFALEPGRFALLGFAEPPLPADLRALERPPAMVAREGGETTLLVRAEELEGLLARHPAARVEADLRWIRFELPMGWELVGFLALVTGRLAAAGVPIGALSAYSRDHLFVAEKKLEPALRVLRELFPEVPHP